MKIKFFLTSCLCLILSAVSIDATISKQTDIQEFWKNFKAVVMKRNKNAVATMTKFPLGMPTFQKSVRARAELIRRYNNIFNGEADAAKCFAEGKLEKENLKRYAIYCGFKTTPNDRDNTPIKYYFELTKNGWKFAGLDNINE